MRFNQWLGPVSTEAWMTVGVLLAVLGGLVFTRRAPDIILAAGLTLLMVLPTPTEQGWRIGVIGPSDALAGLANPAVATVAALFVVAAGLRETGALQWIVRVVLGQPGSLPEAQARVMLPVAASSALINNTPVVAMFIPAVLDWARKLKLSPSHLLIPLSYAAILGGLCTLIGTSTNLVVNGLLIAETAHAGLGMFEIAWVGVPCALAGLGYLLLFGRRLLPARKPPISITDDPREYTVEMLVDPGGLLVGQTIEQAGLRHLPGVYLMEIERDGQTLMAVGPEQVLRAGDRLVFVGVVASVVDLQKIRGLVPATDQVFKLDAPRSQRVLIEAVVSNTCPLVGRSIREGRFRGVYGAAVIAVARNGQRIERKIGDIVLRPGDTLLLEATGGFVAQHRNRRDFYLVSSVADSTPVRHERAAAALGLLLGMVAAVTLGLLSMLQAALVAGGLMIVSRCVSGNEARRAIDWSLLIVIAAALGIGRAVQVTGAAQAIGHGLIDAAGSHPMLMLIVIYGLTMLFTEMITNNAAAVLVFPVALAAADELGVSPMPFVIAVMLAASASFATPLGYQTNLMVYGPGGYRFGDYLRIGLPLNLLVGTITVVLVPQIWPF